MEDGAVLGRVDVLAAKHPRDLVLEPGRGSEVQELLEDLGRDVLAGEIHVDAVMIAGEGADALWLLELVLQVPDHARLGE